MSLEVYSIVVLVELCGEFLGIIPKCMNVKILKIS